MDNENKNEIMNDDFERYNDLQEDEKKHKPKNFVYVLLGVFIGILLCVVSFGAYYFIEHKDDLRIISYNDAGQNTADTDDSEDTSVVNETAAEKLELLEETIDEYYLDSDSVDVDTLEDGMYEGLLEALGDPYSVYYTQEELESLLNSTEGVYYGIGAYISTDEDTGLPMISGVISGTPAEEAGLREGDICVEVDGESTEGMELDEFVSKVKGEEGTTVKLTILRDGESDYLEFEVERRKVESPTVSYEMKDSGIGYIKISEFDSVTTDQFTDALATLKGQDMKGLIIDLRNNPGGSLSTVCDIAEQLLPEGTIVYTVDKNGDRTDYDCDGENEFTLPLVVLVNGNSASASEILAGAIKDYGIGTIVGTTTYGKGIVQRVIPFSDGTAVKLTVSKYYTPSGVNIHGTGIEPDVTVEFDSESYLSTGEDNQLSEAISIIEGELE